MAAMRHNADRLQAVRGLGLLDTPCEESFDRLVDLATRILHVPVAYVGILEEDRQFFKSAVGMPEPIASTREVPLDYSLCQHVIDRVEPLAIGDTLEDARVCNNLAVQELGVRAYLGIPLLMLDRLVVGSLCAIDMHSRVWTENEITIMQDLASSVMTEIQSRLLAAENLRRAEEIDRERAEKLALLESTGEGIYGLDRAGRCTYLNRAGAEMLGCEPDGVLGQNMHALAHHTRADGSPFTESECLLFQSTQAGEGIRLDGELFWRSDGSAFPVECSCYPIIQHGSPVGAVVAFRDITERKKADEALRAAYDRERRIAEALQNPLLLRVPDGLSGLEIGSLYRPLRSEAAVGGDFIDVFALPDNRVAMIIGDVCGKGLSAAVHIAQSKNALRLLLQETPDSPAEALARASSFLYQHHVQNANFVCAAAVVIHPESGAMWTAVGGMLAPFAVTNTGETRIVGGLGLPLGVQSHQTYDQKASVLAPDDTLFLITDGLVEARTGETILGYDNLMTRAAEATRESAGESLDTLGERLLQDVLTVTGGELQDDVSILMARCAA